MLASLRPGVIEEWQAFDRIEPFGDEQLTRLFLYALAAMGTEAEWETLRQRDPAEPESAEGQTIEETTSLVNKAFGL